MTARRSRAGWLRSMSGYIFVPVRTRNEIWRVFSSPSTIDAGSSGAAARVPSHSPSPTCRPNLRSAYRAATLFPPRSSAVLRVMRVFAAKELATFCSLMRFGGWLGPPVRSRFLPLWSTRRMKMQLSSIATLDSRRFQIDHSDFSCPHPKRQRLFPVRCLDSRLAASKAVQFVVNPSP
jgi:hypothetical protein